MNNCFNEQDNQNILLYEEETESDEDEEKDLCILEYQINNGVKNMNYLQIFA